MKKIELVRAQTGDAERIHEMKYRVFLPLFEKYQDEQTMRISPLFLLPEFQGRGIGYQALTQTMAMYPQAEVWRLATIKEEKGNCHLYEKCGFVRTGERPENERMTLVFYDRKEACI